MEGNVCDALFYFRRFFLLFVVKLVLYTSVIEIMLKIFNLNVGVINILIIVLFSFKFLFLLLYI